MTHTGLPDQAGPQRAGPAPGAAQGDGDGAGLRAGHAVPARPQVRPLVLLWRLSAAGLCCYCCLTDSSGGDDKQCTKHHGNHALHQLQHAVPPTLETLHPKP